jgi:integrase
MRSKSKLPAGLYRRKKNGRELPTLWCWYYRPGCKQPMRESTRTDDVETAERFRHARLAETGQVRAQRRHRTTVRVKELLDLVVKDYGDEGREVPPGIYESLNYALGHLRAVEEVESTMLDDLCREWRRGGVRWQKDAAGTVTERPTERVRPVTQTTCNRYIAFLRRGYTLGKKKLGVVHPTLSFPQYTEPKNPRPIPPDAVDGIFAALDSEPEPRAKLLRFLYLAGPRAGQVLGTLAGQFTPATGTVSWTDEDTKQGLPHIVTYTGEALDILRWFAEHRDPACVYLFQEDGAPLTKDKLDGAWQRACVAAGLPVGRKHGGYTIHNLRHTYVSDAHDAGLAAGVIMAHTGHIQEPTMLRYLRVSSAAQGRAQQTLEEHRRAQAERIAEQRAKVVRLTDRRVAG